MKTGRSCLTPCFYFAPPMPLIFTGNIESRRTSVNDTQIVFLAEALGVEIGDLFPQNRPWDRSR